MTLVWNVSRTYTSISTHTLTWSVTSATRGDYHDMDISTHTLTWSVTFRPERYYDLRSISTHTLTWSVTNKG